MYGKEYLEKKEAKAVVGEMLAILDAAHPEIRRYVEADLRSRYGRRSDESLGQQLALQSLRNAQSLAPQTYDPRPFSGLFGSII